MKKEKIYWIGIRESEIASSCFFDGSITIFGSNKNNNISYDHAYNKRFDYNFENEDWTNFLLEKMEGLIALYSNCKFMLYDTIDLDCINEKLSTHLICNNNLETLTLLNDKLETRILLRDIVPIIPFVEIANNEVQYDKMKSFFPQSESFILQNHISCGGNGTWLICNNQIPNYDMHDSLTEKYTVMPYIRNSISINIHVMIYEESYYFFHPSIQIIESSNKRLMYKGSDFLAYNDLSEIIKKSVIGYTDKICKKLQSLNYKGVCGIDYLIDKNDVYFMEINPRFQSSSFLINMSLKKQYNITIHDLQNEAFTKKETSFPDVFNTDISYAFYHYSYQHDKLEALKMLWQSALDSHDIFCMDDDLNWDMNLDNATYLYKLIFKNNIVAISPTFDLIIQHNLIIDDEFCNKFETLDDILKLKIALLTHGIQIEQSALNYLEAKGEINYEEFQAIDLKLEIGVYMNIPYKTSFSSISPFRIMLDANQDLLLKLFDKTLSKVTIRGVNPFNNNITKNGFLFKDISYLTVDRLRLYHRCGCYFKNINKGCKFCDVEEDCRSIPVEDLIEVLESYLNNNNTKHILIGGGSESPTSDFSNIINIVKEIRKKTDKSIYLMSLPPNNNDILDELCAAGVNEVSFDIEIYDRRLAKEIMEGKSSITISKYLDTLKYAVGLWGNQGAVRTIFIVGLEPEESLLRGIEDVCKLGVSPILSLFKPIKNTEMEKYLPFSDERIYNVCKQIDGICKKHKVPLGPICHYCEDNTLKVSIQN